MALRLGEYVLGGFVNGKKKNGTHGAIHLRGREGIVLSLEVVGAAGEGIRGHCIEFEARPNPMRDPDPLPDFPVRSLKVSRQQVGAAGTMEIRQVRVAPCTDEQLIRMMEAHDPPPMEWKPLLYLEWYGPNGRTVIELVDPKLTDLDEKGNEIGAVETGHGPELDPQTGRPYNATPPTPEELEEIERIMFGDPSEEELYPGEFPDVPEADPAAPDYAIQQAELMDDLMSGGDEVPLASLFEKPMRLPAEGTIPDDQIEGVFRGLVAQLAMINVGFHMCDHFDARRAYKLLTEKILWDGTSFRELKGSGWTMNYMTAEYCEDCDREFEERWARENPPKGGGEEGGEEKLY